jgi:hypothetical protein
MDHARKRYEPNQGGEDFEAIYSCYRKIAPVVHFPDGEARVADLLRQYLPERSLHFDLGMECHCDVVVCRFADHDTEAHIVLVEVLSFASDDLATDAVADWQLIMTRRRLNGVTRSASP